MIFDGFVGRIVEVQEGRRKGRMRKNRNDGKLRVESDDVDG